MGKQVHIVMFPWFAVGHITAFLHLANKLAERGHKTTFLLPNNAISRFNLTSLILHPSLIILHPITVPHVNPLPPGTETASDIPLNLNNHLASAFDLTRPQVERVIMNLDPNPNLLFYDMAHWIPEIASKLTGAKTVCYNTVSAASIAICLVPAARGIIRDKPIDQQAWLPQGYPSSSVVLRGLEWRKLLSIESEFGSGITFYERITMAIHSCDAIAFRTCTEIEKSFCDYLASQYNKPIFLTGPVLAEPDSAITSPLDQKWADWLGRFGTGSVVFCAFGSQFVPEKEQLQELLLGFEMAGKPFLVAVKTPSGCTSIEEAYPDGFEERVRDRGVVCGSWVQQPQILAHPSVGCFVSHCGFSSMWESLMSESQIVLVPQLGEQVLNSRILAEEMKVAVEVERDDDGWVSKENLCKAIKSVMDQGSEVGEMLKKNHANWRQVFVSKGFMNGYVDNFVKDLEMLLGGNSGI